MMKNYDESVKINWPYIADHMYRILIIDGSVSGKTNVLLNNQMLTKYIYMSKIHLNQSINCYQKRKRRD